VAKDETAIETVAADKMIVCTIYNANGVECARYACRYDEVKLCLESQGLPKGVYMLRMATESIEIVEKYVVK
jgi:hypothetical protein